MLKKHIPIEGLMLILVLAGTVRSQTSSAQVFEAKKAEYLRTNGDYLINYMEKVWAWLEKIKLNQMNPSADYVKDVDGVSRPVGQVISSLIHCWGERGYEWPPPYPPYGYAWNWGQWTTSTSLVWILLKYDMAISSSDKIFLQKLYDSYITANNFSPGSENSQIQDMVGRYLWAQYRRDVRVQYATNPPPNENIFAFSWRGRSYVPGNTYSAYELTRDWIQYNMDLWVRAGNRELDSPAYTWCFIHAFVALYECAAYDPEMKQMAQMMVDFLLLDSVMDYSAKHWGGSLGRCYDYTYGGRTAFYWDFFWNSQTTAFAPSYNVLMSGYRLPEVIWDLSDFSEEPDNYYHINMENNRLAYRPGTGKWTYVTKFFNMGGQLTSGWTLNIKSDDTPGTYNHPGVPFTLWINTYVGGTGTSTPVAGMTYLTLGEWGYQYKNAMFIRASQLHIVTSPNAWDADQTVGSFRFLKEGRTMVAIATIDSLELAGLEVDIEGADFTDFEQFKYAVRTRCTLDRWGFKTTKGDYISFDQWSATGDWTAVVKKAGSTKFEWVWPFPFQRIQTIDYRNRGIVHWEGNQMILKSKSLKRQRTYDFNNWTVSELSWVGDETPPLPPQQVGVTVK